MVSSENHLSAGFKCVPPLSVTRMPLLTLGTLRPGTSSVLFEPSLTSATLDGPQHDYVYDSLSLPLHGPVPGTPITGLSSTRNSSFSGTTVSPIPLGMSLERDQHQVRLSLSLRTGTALAVKRL